MHFLSLLPVADRLPALGGYSMECTSVAIAWNAATKRQVIGNTIFNFNTSKRNSNAAEIWHAFVRISRRHGQN
jgi:hypothetical protein